MRIVIDMQGAQTESRFRGIGRYTLSFARSIAKNRGDHEVILALSGLFPDTIEPIRAAFHGLLAQENIRVWYAPAPVQEQQTDNGLRRCNAELIREAFLASLQPDVIHICSLFEGYVDDAVVSIGRLDTASRVTVSLYDLIPLLNPGHYLQPNTRYAAYYQRKLSCLQQAAGCLAISESAQQEGLAHLNGVPSAHIVNVSTAIDPFFQPLGVTGAGMDISAASLPEKWGIARPFVLYAGGADERKNLPRLLQAYAALPTALRHIHQLVLAGKFLQPEIAQLQQQARTVCLAADELRFTGYVTDEELLQLYQSCQLFVFPSWHEGFGLPALEAMACGAPVIGANTSSVPEVIGWSEALFDPLDTPAITAKMAQALSDSDFRAQLRRNGLQQAPKFSWDATAQRALTAWENLMLPAQSDAPDTSALAPPEPQLRPLLIFVTPLPPERTGIANYSAELLPALAQHYDIDVVVAQPSMAQITPSKHYRVRSMAWFQAHAPKAARVVYQFGNSPFHAHMFQALAQVPGVVVLHDFFLSGVIHHMDEYAGLQGYWLRELHYAHGYQAAHERILSQNYEVQTRQYPCNRSVLENSLGLIVHSENPRHLIQQWYGPHFQKNIDTIALLRAPAPRADRADQLAARQQLGLGADDFIVCSFGFLDESKLNHRLLQAWLDSELFQDSRCRLIFVGENHGGHYGTTLLKTMRTSGAGERLQITGFTSAESYRLYLFAADTAVQLRAHSRGETSAAVLDCMNHALPLVVNANGSMAELDPSAVWLLPDDFADHDLIDALQTLWRDPARRAELGARARSVIENQHAPAHCAQRYAQAIERSQQLVQGTPQRLVQAITAQPSFAAQAQTDAQLQQLAHAVAATLTPQRAVRRLFLDISATSRHDLKTGIERVVRALLLALLQTPPSGYRIEPVYLRNTGQGWHYRSANQYTLGLLGSPSEVLSDDTIDPENGDIVLSLDISHELIQAQQQGLFAHYRQRGVRVLATVYDLLPVTLGHVFPPQAEQNHAQWLYAVTQFDGAVCISCAVAQELADWKAHHTPALPAGTRPYTVDWFHLGADLSSSAPSRGLPDNAPALLNQLRSRPSFLMVGTIEPRKGYLQALDAFSQLWAQGVDVHLVIVGRQGWVGLPPADQRDIPETIRRLQTHPENGQRLHWLDGVSDEYLDQLYAHSTCLLAASYGEGFGLPLIEAAQHQLPILARDIPVFREVAGVHACYFDGLTPHELAAAIERWLALHASGQHPPSHAMPWLTWQASAAQLLQRLLPTPAAPAACVAPVAGI